MAEIRKAADADKPAVWQIIRSVIAGGDTYVFDPETPEDEMITYWFSPEKHVYVAEENGEILGTYWLKANQPGLGDHVGNGAYMVSPEAKGKGIGRMMAEHSIEEARRIGFRAIQFNFVVKSNTVALNLWKSVGFEVIGEIPDAIRHKRDGLTNAYIMYRKLSEKPWHTREAKANGASGLVQVEVLIDTNGSVIQARGRTGNKFLHPEAERAALASKFNRPTFGGKPARAIGFLVYRFGPDED